MTYLVAGLEFLDHLLVALVWVEHLLLGGVEQHHELLVLSLRHKFKFKIIIFQILNEVSFLKQQCVQLQQEKMRLQQNTIMVDNRVTNLEGEVGYE